MKKIIWIILLLFFAGIVNSQNFSLGVYYNASSQYANFFGESNFLKPEKRRFNGLCIGIQTQYKFSNSILLKANIGYSENSLFLHNQGLPLFHDNGYALGLGLRTNLFNIANLGFYVENGLNFSYFNSFYYNRTFYLNHEGNIISGSIGEYDIMEKFAFGLKNGVGLTYLIKSKFEIDLFINYISGLHKVWENNQIFIVKDDLSTHTYSISSNSSRLNIGISLNYFL